MLEIKGINKNNLVVIRDNTPYLVGVSYGVVNALSIFTGRWYVWKNCKKFNPDTDIPKGFESLDLLVAKIESTFNLYGDRIGTEKEKIRQKVLNHIPQDTFLIDIVPLDMCEF